MENAIGALVVAALSALGYITYRHPEIFPAIMRPLCAITFAVVAVTAIWDISNQSATIAALPYLAEGKLDAARAAIKSVQIPIWWSLGGCAAFVAYLFALAALSDYLQKQKPVQRQRGDKGGPKI